MIDFESITSIVDSLGDAIDETFTTDEERLAKRNELEKIKAAIKEREIQLKTKELELEKSLMEQAHKTNQIEAGHKSVFVSGWRPSIGWICALGMGWQFFFAPLFQSIIQSVVSLYNPLFDLSKLPVPPTLDMQEFMPLVIAMLGLGGMRTYEKNKGVASSYITNQKVGLKKI